MESRIVSLLENDASIAALISDRIYPQAVPETGELPALIYTSVSNNSDHEFDGVNEIKKTRLQITAWSKGYATSKQLTNEVIRLFDGYSAEFNGIKFHSIFLESAVDMYNSDLKEYGNNIDLIINYEEI